MQISKIIIAIILVLVNFLVFYNTLHFDFVWDDSTLINDNPYIKSFSFIPLFFTQDIWKISYQSGVSGYYRPILAFSFMADYCLWQKNPFGYHLSNILFNSLVCVMLFLFLESLLKGRLIPLLCALLFCVHPLHAEAVSFISGRVDILCFLFMLLSLWLFLKFTRSKITPVYFLSLLCFFIALLIKEMAVTLPLIVICIDGLFLSDRQKVKRRFENFLRFHLGFFLVLFFYMALRWHFVGWEFLKLKMDSFSNFYPGAGLFWRPLTVFKITWLYIRMLIFPYGLKADYVFQGASSVFEPAVICGMLSFIFAGYFALRNIKNNPAVAFCLAWFFITALPVLNIFPSGNIFAERFMYIPSAGFCLALALLFGGAARKDIKTSYFNWPFCVYLIFCFLVVAFGRITQERNKVWKNNLTLWYETAQSSPQSPRAHLNLANIYSEAGLLDKATEEYNIGLKLIKDPRWAYYVFNNLGNVYLKKGLIDEAIKSYKIAINLIPERALAYANLSSAYGKKGKYKESIEEAQIALKNNPYLDDARFNLATSYANLGWDKEAVKEYEKYIKLNPENPAAEVELGNLYFKKGDIAKAKTCWQAALNVNKAYQPALEAVKLLKDKEVSN